MHVPGVGLNLRDHITQAFRVAVPSNFGIISGSPSILSIVNAFFRYLWYGDGPLTTSGLDAHIFTKSKIAKRDGLKSNDLQLVSAIIGENENEQKANENLNKFFNWDVTKSPMFSIKRKNPKHDQQAMTHSLMAATMLVRPKSVGTLKLVSSDPYDHPLCDPKYLSHPDDIEAFVDGWMKMLEVFESETCKKNGFEVVEFEDLKDKEEWARSTIENNGLTIYHPVGTCKMGNLETDKS